MDHGIVAAGLKIGRPQSQLLVQRRSSNGRITHYAEKLIFTYSISLCVSLPRTVAAAVTALRARPQAPAASLRHKDPWGISDAGSALHVLCHVSWLGSQQCLDRSIKLAHGIVVAVAHRANTAALHSGGLLGEEHGVALGECAIAAVVQRPPHPFEVVGGLRNSLAVVAIVFEDVNARTFTAHFVGVRNHCKWPLEFSTECRLHGDHFPAVGPCLLEQLMHPGAALVGAEQTDVTVALAQQPGHQAAGSRMLALLWIVQAARRLVNKQASVAIWSR